VLLHREEPLNQFKKQRGPEMKKGNKITNPKCSTGGYCRLSAHVCLNGMATLKSDRAGAED
jgi:hypothetical protein